MEWSCGNLSMLQVGTLVQYRYAAIILCLDWTRNSGLARHRTTWHGLFCNVNACRTVRCRAVLCCAGPDLLQKLGQHDTARHDTAQLCSVDRHAGPAQVRVHYQRVRNEWFVVPIAKDQ